MTETVTVDYLIKHCSFTKAHAYRWLEKKGVKPIIRPGISRSVYPYHYIKAEVDQALQGYVARPRAQNKAKAVYFTFNDFQMEVMRFCRGDYTSNRGLG